MSEEEKDIQIVAPMDPAKENSPIVKVKAWDLSSKRGRLCLYGGANFGHCSIIKVQGTGDKLHCNNGNWESCL